ARAVEMVRGDVHLDSRAVGGPFGQADAEQAAQPAGGSLFFLEVGVVHGPACCLRAGVVGKPAYVSRHRESTQQPFSTSGSRSGGRGGGKDPYALQPTG